MTKTQKGNIKLFVIMMVMHQFFFLLPEKIGPLSWFNILFLLSGGYVFYSFCKEKGHFVLGEYGYIILVIPIFIVLSAVGGYIHYGQSVISGLITQRLWLTTAWLYFVIMYMIREGELTYDSFVQVLYAVVGTELVIYYIQYFLGEEHMFLNVLYGHRNGSIRLFCTPNYLMFTVLIAMDNLLKRKNILRDILFVAAIMLYYAIVWKSRGAILTLMFSLGMILLLSKDLPVRVKIVAIAIAVVAGTVYIMKSYLIRSVFAIIFQGKEDYSWGVRTGAYRFYLQKWVSTPYAFLFGYGYGNSNIEASCIATGVMEGFKLVDNGVLSFVFCYGLVGVIWYAWYLFLLFRSGIRAYKNNNSVLLVKCLAGLINITTSSQFFYVHYSFDMILHIVMAELLDKESGREINMRFPPEFKLGRRTDKKPENSL